MRLGVDTRFSSKEREVIITGKANGVLLIDAARHLLATYDAVCSGDVITTEEMQRQVDLAVTAFKVHDRYENQMQFGDLRGALRECQSNKHTTEYKLKQTREHLLQLQFDYSLLLPAKDLAERLCVAWPQENENYENH